MALKHALALYTGSPNGVKEVQIGDTIDPVDLGISGGPVGTTDTQTLTNKTLTAPRVNQINDTNGVKALGVTATATAVNDLVIANSATGQPVTLTAEGSDATVAINLVSKGGAGVLVDGSALITASSTTTLTNKTHTDPRLSDNLLHDCAIAANVPGGGIYDATGELIWGILDAGASGSYLGVRAQGATNLASPSIVACGPQPDYNILLQPKGAGDLRVRTATGFNAVVVNAYAVQDGTDYHAISVPPGSASTLGGSLGNAYSAGLAPVDIVVDQNIAWMFPVIVPRNGTSSTSLTGVRVCTGAANAAAGTIYVGVYSNAGGQTPYPGITGTSLQSGSAATIAITANTSTVFTSTAMTAALVPGTLVWFGFVCSINTIEMRCHNIATPRLNVLGGLPSSAAGGLFNVTSGGMYTGMLSVYTPAAAFPANYSSLLPGVTLMTNLNAATNTNLMFSPIWGS